MKLFLCSTSINEPLKVDFEELIQREMKGLRIACIITGAMGYKAQIEASGEVWDLSWLYDSISEFENQFSCKIDQYDLNDMRESEIQGLYSKYDGVWVQGGITSFLLEAIYNRNAKDLLVKFAMEKFYIGSSAGSMICAKDQDASEWFLDEPETQKIKYEGLDLIPFQFYPHFREEQYDEIVKHCLIGNEYWLVKDGQAIAYDGSDFKVCGGEIKVIKRL